MPRWLNEYSMLAVLLALCAFFTAMTWGRLRQEGKNAARELAARIEPNQRVAIVTVKGTDGEVFAEELQSLLAKKDATVVATVSGEPFEVLAALPKEVKQDAKVDALAVHPLAYTWTVFDRLAEAEPRFAKIPIMAPASYSGSSFLRTQNLLNIANQNAVYAIIAVGMTLVIITGGIDLSVGSLVALSAVLTTWLIRASGGTEASVGAMLGCGAVALAACGAMGGFSGFMITQFRIPPFIVTLSVMMIASGLAMRISQSESIDQVPPSFQWLAQGTLIPNVRNALLLMLILYVIAHLVMTRTVFGRHIYAVGGNPKAAWLSGLPVKRVLMAVYILGGVLAGLGGIVMASQLKSANSNYGQMYEMFVIASVVVGGTSLSGGEGRIIDTLIGALIIAVIQNGMNLLGIESPDQRIVLGAMILGAVLLDRLKKRA
jgi:ribose transport system permease protein